MSEEERFYFQYDEIARALGYQGDSAVNDHAEVLQLALKSDATLRYCEKQWSDERSVMIGRIQAVKNVRDCYANQARFADIDCAVHFREFVRRIDTALSVGMVQL